MSMTIESESITSLLLSIDKGNFAPSEYAGLSNKISERTVEVVNDAAQAKVLFEAEKARIAKRGNDSSAYLSRNNVTIKEVLETYYRGVVDTKEGRKLSGAFTISEMMLMLGTFNHLMLVRQIYLDGYKWNLRKIKAKRMIQKIAGKLKKDTASADDLSFMETLTKNSKECEERMLFYLRNQVTIIMNAILEELGTDLKGASRKQLEGICLESHEICTYGSSLNEYFEKRKKEGTEVFKDVALLDACGERSADLYRVLATETYTEAKEKRK